MKNNRGFTLFETLVYLALLGLVFTGLLVAGFAVIENLEVLKTRAALQEEGNFLLAKINWAINGASSVQVPSPSRLILTRPGLTPAQVEFTVAGNNLAISQDGLVAPLNASIIQLKNVAFSATATDLVIIPISASFVLQIKTPAGKDYSQNFELTNYLKK